ncbi:MAG: RNA polymerase sigma factor [Rhodospirillales bacterium]|nr:RNA polymerase sigma factor [Rhodospirillales bacterium]
MKSVNARGRIEGYLPRLYGYALSLARDPHQAEDLVQDCAVKALSARNTPADEAAFRSWLFKILRNAFFDRLRRAKVATAYTEDPKHYPEMEYWRGDERFITVLTAKLELEKLPQPQREIIALIDIAGLSYAEAAQILGLPKGTIMSRISRARRALLEAISSGNIRVLPVKKKNKGLQ